VHDLIKLQNGTVRAESDGEGLGATFTILLAAQVDSESSVKVLDASASMGKFAAQSFQPDLKGICVLVVEDEASSLDALSETLGSFGASTVPCSSADQAMTALQSSKAAIIISDIAMPGQDGYSLMKAIRKLPPERGGRIPALALTAYASKEDIDVATAAGFDAHMSKPYDISVLANMVLSLIGRVVGKD
jgi:CheY-like chemotaxis protein